MGRRQLALFIVVIAEIVALSSCGRGPSGSTASPVGTANNAGVAPITTAPPPPPTSVPTPTTTKSSLPVISVISTYPALSTAGALFTDVNLEGSSVINGEGPYTVFVPTNSAFASLPTPSVYYLHLLCNRQILTEILTYHVLPGRIPSSSAVPGKRTTVEGEFVTLGRRGHKLTVNGATVETANIPASNGIVHVIDKVLVPPSLHLSKLKHSC